MSKLDKQIEDFIQWVEVASHIALHNSLEDGDPKHHKKFVADAKKKIKKINKELIHSESIKARLSELEKVKEVAVKPQSAETVAFVLKDYYQKRKEELNSDSGEGKE